jgi:hypothetical protein
VEQVLQVVFQETQQLMLEAVVVQLTMAQVYALHILQEAQVVEVVVRNNVDRQQELEQSTLAVAVVVEVQILNLIKLVEMVEVE